MQTRDDFGTPLQPHRPRSNTTMGYGIPDLVDMEPQNGMRARDPKSCGFCLHMRASVSQKLQLWQSATEWQIECQNG